MKALHCIRTGILISVIFSSLILAQGLLPDSGSKLKVWTEMTKQEYRVCEEAFIYLVVTNPTDRTLEAPFLEEGSSLNMKMQLLHPTGHRQAYRGISHPIPRKPIQLAPGDTIIFPITLLGCFGVCGERDELPGCILPGLYSVEITYAQQYDISPIMFRVLDTYSADSLQISAINNLLMTRRTPEQGVLLFNDLYDKLAGSPLQTRVTSSFICEIMAQSKPQLSDAIYVRKFMRDHPESGRMLQAFGLMLSVFGEQQLKAAIDDQPMLVNSRFGRHQLRVVLHCIGKSNLYEELLK